MCGICGIINLKNESVKKSNIQNMMDIIKHRGPDDEGIFIDNNVGLGHVRLSIIDLSDAGHQPMFDNDNRYVIIFNGEIYNYIELRKELKLNYSFRTKSDTEVLLAAYIVWGENCLDRFNGDFAFVIYDKKEKTIFGARDRYGIKPFYYTIQNNTLYFGSEIKSLLPFLGERKVNEKIMYEFIIYNRTDQGKETFFDDIYKIPHGYYFSIKNNRFKLFQWYNLKDKIIPNSKMSSADFRLELNSAIHYRLRSDVPLGVSLSGGLDSSTIVSSLINDFSVDNLNTFSAVYGKSESADESEFIDEYRSSLKNMYFTYPSSKTFFDDYEDFVYMHGEPMANLGPYAQYKVMELASDFVKVTIDGQGADEQLGGYHYFFGSYFNELLNSFRLLTLSKEIVKYFSIHKSLMGMKYFLYYLLPLKYKDLITKNVFEGINQDFFNRFYKESTISADLFSPKGLMKSLFQHFEYKLEHLLKWEDHNGMKFSIESRVPFLDHNLVEKTLSLSSDHIINAGHTKVILRQAYSDILPKKILQRQDKKGFETPSSKWFKTEVFQKLILDIINSKEFEELGYFDTSICKKKYSQHLTGNIDHSKDIWKWVNVYTWHKNFIKI